MSSRVHVPPECKLIFAYMYTQLTDIHFFCHVSVKMHAVRSTGVVFPGVAEESVNKVFQAAYSDEAPFNSR